MPDISKIKLLDGNTFNLKDANAVKSVTESEGVVTVTKQDNTSSSFNVITQHQDISTLAPKNSPNFTGTPTAPTASKGTSNTQIATTAFVMDAFEINDAMVFKGTIGSSGATITSLPQTHLQGWTYKVITAGTYAGKVCEIGDMIICVTSGTSTSNDHWTVVQANIDGAVTGPVSSTDEHIAVFNGASGKVIKDSGFTIGKSVPSNAEFTDTTYEVKNASASGTEESLVTTGEKYTWNNKSDFSGSYNDLSNKPTIPTQTSDLINNSGFVTTDTKNTAGSTDTNSKIFLIGATSQAANPQTYSHDTAYVGADGCLYSDGKKVKTEDAKYRLWYKNVPVSAINGSIIDLVDSDITDDYILEGNNITWGDESKITSLTQWSTDTTGHFIVTGTCSAATTATFALVMADKKTVY